MLWYVIPRGKSYIRTEHISKEMNKYKALTSVYQVNSNRGTQGSILIYFNSICIFKIANQYPGFYLQNTVLFTFSYCHLMLKILQFEAKV